MHLYPTAFECEKNMKMGKAKTFLEYLNVHLNKGECGLSL